MRPTHETASSLARRAHCPGSARMERGQPDQPTDESRAGDRVHAVLAGTMKLEDLSEAEQTTVEILRAREEKAVAPYMAEHGVPHVVREWRYSIELHGKPVFSAQLDVVYELERLTVILDYKSLFGDVPEAADNYQILGQVAAYAAEAGLYSRPVLAGIVQTTGPVEMVQYDDWQQRKAIIQVQDILAKTEAADAPLKTGPHCTYCKGKLSCPAITQSTLALAKPAPDMALLSGDKLAETMNACAIVKKFIAAAEAETRRRLEKGEAVGDYTLEPGATRRVVTDAQAALAALAPHGVTVQQVLDCVEVKVSGLESALKAATGRKGKGLTELFNTTLTDAGCLEMKQNAPSLKRTQAN